MFRRLRAGALACASGFATAAAARARRVVAPAIEPPGAIPPAVPPAGPPPAALPTPGDAGKHEAPGSSDPLFLARPADAKRFPLEASWDNGLWFEAPDK